MKTRFVVALALLMSLFFMTSAFASGNYRVSWTQPMDCEYADHWELDIDGVTLPDTLVGVCGGVMTQIVFVPGVGVKTFRMRAVTADGTYSDYSNGIQENVPFGAPGLAGVERVTE